MLSPKQEAFCQRYLETGNASEAYRKAGYSSNMSDKTVNEASSRLLKNNKVLARVAELQAATVKRHELTIDDIINELEQARVAAQQGDKPQAAAMVAASMGKAKVLGFLIDKAEVKFTAHEATLDDLI